MCVVRRQVLLDARASPLASDRFGWTALHHLAESSRAAPEPPLSSLLLPSLQAHGCHLHTPARNTAGSDADGAVARALLDAAGPGSINLSAHPAERAMRLVCCVCRFVVRAAPHTITHQAATREEREGE